MTSVTVRYHKKEPGIELTHVIGQLHGSAPGDTFTPADFGIRSIHSIQLTPITTVAQLTGSMAIGSVGVNGQPTVTLDGSPTTVINANFEVWGE